MAFFSKLFSKPPDKDAFAKAVLDGIVRAGEKLAVVYDKEQFAVRTPGKDGHLLNLGNAYPEFCAVPKANRPEMVKKWVRVWFAHHMDIPSDFEDVRPDLLPTVQARSHYELVDLQFQVEGRGKLNRPYQVFGEHFAVGLVYDLPETMKHITQDVLDKWGVTLYEALEVARHNLAEKPFAFLGSNDGEGVPWSSVQKDSYDAARILLLDAIRGLRVRGEIVAMIPNREALLIAGSDDLNALKYMLTWAQESMQQPRYISGIALRLDGDEWTPWLPDADHPLYWDFRKLQTQSLGQACTEQKELLEKLHEKTGEDAFVASFSGFTPQGTDHFTSYCVWGNGVLAWLPRTDLIAFIEKDKNPLMVPWDRAVEVVGNLMEAVDIYPPRFQVKEFPSIEQLAAMGDDGQGVG